MKETRALIDLASVGPATVRDFDLIRITKVEQLVGRDPDDLFAWLELKKGQKVDICCRDVFACAIAQAEDPELPAEQRQWHYWSRLRKAGR